MNDIDVNVMIDVYAETTYYVDYISIRSFASSKEVFGSLRRRIKPKEEKQEEQYEEKHDEYRFDTYFACGKLVR